MKKTNLIAVIAILILLLGVAAGVLLVRRQQVFKSKASENGKVMQEVTPNQ